MLYDIPQNKIEEWKWTNPRMVVQSAIIKKYENELEKGRSIVFSINDLMKNCGYPPERYIRHISFVNIVKSDISLLEPYKLNGGRLIFGFFGYEGGVRKVYYQYIKQEIPELTAEGDIRDGNKNFTDTENTNAENAEKTGESA